MPVRKKEFIQIISEDVGLKEKMVGKVTEGVFRTIVKLLAEGEDLNLYGFGKFVVKTQKTKTWTNPITGVEHNIPSRVIPKFYASSALIQLVRGEK